MSRLMGVNNHVLADACFIWFVVAAVVGISLSCRKGYTPRTCSRCGSVNRGFARFCGRCGNRLK